MAKYINADKLKAEIDNLEPFSCISEEQDGFYSAISRINDIIESLEQPKPYFYCKYGGTMPLCTDCKRNHNNSSFKTEEITTWYVPSNGTKHCIDYIQQEQPDIDLEEEVKKYFNGYWPGMKTPEACNHQMVFTTPAVMRMIKHFYELGLKARK